MNFIKYFTIFALSLILNISLLAQDIIIGQAENSESVSSIDKQGFTVELKLNTLNFNKVKTENSDFYSLDINGFGKSLDYGNPQLPVYKRLMELPEGATYKVVIKKQKSRIIQLSDYGINDYLLPAQLPIPKIENPDINFKFNKSTYNNSTTYKNDLVKIVSLGKMRATSIARLEISPISYNPVDNTIEIVEELEIEVQIANYNSQQLMEDKQRFYSPYFQTLNNRLINGEAYAVAIASTANKYPLKYVIVSDSMFKQALQPFVRWKEKKGFKVIEAYTQDTAVGNSLQSIKTYLQTLYTNATANDPAPVYVLFVGDIAQMPAWPGIAFTGLFTDLYYCEFTNDEFPEMMYGRFSANDTSELNPQINKTIEYETYSMPDPSFLGNSVLIAGHDASHGSTWGDGQINYGTSNYFNTSNSTNCKSYLYVNGSYNKDAEIRQQIDSGCSIANYTAHGSYMGWADPSFNTTHVSSMTNQGKYPLMIGNACITNQFSQNVCFGEALLRANNKGAIGYIGASHNTYWDEDYYWAVGLGTISANPTYNSTGSGLYDRMFHSHGEPFADWAMSSSQYITAGNLAVTQSGSSIRLYWELYHVMGDPSLMAYLKIPDPITASYVPFIQTAWTNFQVNTIPFAQVALSQNSQLISSAIADSNGVANLQLGSFSTLGIMDIVITAQNHAPYFNTVIGGAATGPYVISSDLIIDDSQENNNGIADFGENLKLDVEFTNLTQFMAGMTSAVLQSNDTQIVIIDSLANMGAISAFDTLLFDSIFEISIIANAIDQHIVNLNIITHDTSGAQWTTPIYIPLFAPKIEIISSEIDDSANGNNNGLIEAGENVVIRVLLKNSGSRDAINLICNYTSHNNLAVVASNFTADTLHPNSQVWAEFSVQFDAQLSNGNYIPFTFDYVSQAYTENKAIPQLIGVVDEDFETGDFSKFIWQSINNLDWAIDSTEIYEGQYSSRSSSLITDEDTSSMSVTINVLANDSISFYRKVSCETNYDNLLFFIDGIAQDKWSGNEDWEKFSFAVSAGVHTFEWAYIKDYYLAELEDAAWIDYIKFPPTDAWSSVKCIEDELLNSIQLWPNPTTDKVNISLNLSENGNLSTSIYNQLGQSIGGETNHGTLYSGQNNISLDVSNLSSGIYFIQISFDKQQYFQKLIVK